MDYQVLARKWRPRDFNDLVGQEHVVRVLRNALNSNRFHHALIFTGTRGVGKTTIARVIAKCLNCETGVTAAPCGQCSACKSINDGSFIDLLEVDAASHSKVEETRDLMDSVSYKPVQGRYKIYLIDEVHMFSDKSMNALLKTLEEPPDHAKFLLATTDPQKLPITVLSRCLQFNLRRLSSTLIAQRLEYIAQHEGVTVEAAALALIATAADGSMRDALSLLDEVIAYGDGTVSASDTAVLLGTVDRSRVIALIEAIIAGSGLKTFEIAAAMADDMVDFADVLASMMSCLQRIAVLQIVPDIKSTPLHNDSDAALSAIASRALPEDIQIYYQMVLQGRRDLVDSPDLQTAFDITLVRMLVFVAAADQDPDNTQATSALLVPQHDHVSSTSAVTVTTQTPKPAHVNNAAGHVTPVIETDSNEWEALTAQMPLGNPVRQLAKHCTMDNKNDTSVGLRLPSLHAFLNSKNNREQLTAALTQLRGCTQQVSIRIDEGNASTPTEPHTEQHLLATTSVGSNPEVDMLMKTFNARILSTDSKAPKKTSGR